MKLAAAILFAVTSAQRNEGGRQREKETPSSTDDAFAAYFGAYDGDAFGDYGNAFGAESFGDSYDSADAFGDLTFGNYDGEYVDGVDAVDTAAVEQAVAADEANRPGQDNNDDGKTFLPGDTSNAADETQSAFAAYCWENSASRTSATATAELNWATSGGSFQQCTGKASACEVKVVRDVSSNDIVQIVSKCANEDSCIANMEQNFNPRKLLSPTNSLYNSYMQQSCRPQHLGGNAITFGQRFKSNKQKSTCFFCVEPCASGAAAAGCVGPNAAGTAAMSVPTGSIDLFSETTLSGSDMLADNYYSTVTGTLNPGGKVMTVSKIQADQINAAVGMTFT